MEAEYFCGKVPAGALLFCVLGSLGTGDADCHSRCAHRLRNDSFIFHGGGIEDGFCGGCRGRGNGKETFGLILGEGREVF